MKKKTQLQPSKRWGNSIKQERDVVQNASELLEGILYQSGKFLL